jgi:hypothetical protein
LSRQRELVAPLRILALGVSPQKRQNLRLLLSLTATCIRQTNANEYSELAYQNLQKKIVCHALETRIVHEKRQPRALNGVARSTSPYRWGYNIRQCITNSTQPAKSLHHSIFTRINLVRHQREMQREERVKTPQLAQHFYKTKRNARDA